MATLYTKLLHSRFCISSGIILQLPCCRSIFYGSSARNLLYEPYGCMSWSRKRDVSCKTMLGKSDTFVSKRYFFRKYIRSMVPFINNGIIKSANAPNIARMERVHPSFHGEDFLLGSEQALRVVMDSISQGNLEDLKDLLTEQCYSGVEDILRENSVSLRPLAASIAKFDDLSMLLMDPDEQKKNFLTVFTLTIVNPTAVFCRFVQDLGEGDEASWIISYIEVAQFSGGWLLKKVDQANKNQPHGN